MGSPAPRLSDVRSPLWDEFEQEKSIQTKKYDKEGNL